MAQEDIARLVAVLEANVNNFTKNMDRARRVADREFGAIERRMRTTERGFSRFGGSGLNTIITRYFSIAAAIMATQLVIRESIENNEEASEAWKNLNKEMERTGDVAGPAVATGFNIASAILKRLNDEVESLTRDWNALKLALEGGVNVPLGVSPLQPGYNTTATFDPRTKDWRTSPGGFPVSGVTDVTPGQDRELEEALRFGEEMAEMARRMQAERIETEEETQQRLLADALAFGEELLADARQLSAERIELEEQTQQRLLEDALEYGEQWNEQIRELTADRIAAQLEEQASRIQQIGDEFEYLAHAAFAGADAFKRAIASMAQSLVVSGLRKIFEGFLGSLAGGSGFLAGAISGRAHGGRVNPNQPYIVGERRPELFVPDTAGTIIPKLPTIPSPQAQAMGGMIVNLQQTMSLAANGDAQLAQLAKQAALDGANLAVRSIQRSFPSMMIKAQRDRL